MNTKAYDVIYIGNYTKDTIIRPSGTQFVDGGGSRYAAYAAAALGLKVGVVTHLSREDMHVVAKYNLGGIDCYPVYTPSSTLMCLEYPTADPDIRTLTVTGLAGNITWEELQGLEMVSAAINSSVRGEVGLDVIKGLKARKVKVAADMQGFVRVLRGNELKYERWPEMQETLACIDILKSDAVEAEFLTGEKDIFKAARIFASLGPKEIVLTHRDGLLVYAGGQFHELDFYPLSLEGRSGRGDTCIGTYVAMRVTKDPLEAGMWAAAVTSLKMEKLGPFDRSMTDVQDLLHARYNHGSFG